MLKLSGIFTNNHILRINIMKLASLIKMPSLSPTMTEGGIVEWHRKEGDKIFVGDLVCDIQTDKAIVGLEAEEDGILAKIIKPNDSQNIQIGETIGMLADLDEDWKSIQVPNNNKEEKKTISSISIDKKSVDEKEKSNISLQKMGPAVRRLLDTYGLESNKIDHSGPHSTLIKSDILNFINREKLNPKQAVQLKEVLPPKKSESKHLSQTAYLDIPVSEIRQAIAKRTCLSKLTIPHFYTTGDASLDALLKIKNQLKKHGIFVSVNDIIVKACSLALRLIPAVNSSMNPDGSIKFNESVDISFAVEINGGLITPIIFGADKLALIDIAKMTHDLAEKARINKLESFESMGGTFTITNLGPSGIREFTATITTPQAAILAVGSEIVQLTSDLTSSLRKETRIRFTLCADIRIVDEASAAMFIHYVKSYIENPTFLLGFSELLDKHNSSEAFVY